MEKYIAVSESIRRGRVNRIGPPVRLQQDVMIWSSHKSSGNNVRALEQNKTKSANVWNRNKKKIFMTQAILIIISR